MLWAVNRILWYYNDRKLIHTHYFKSFYGLNDKCIFPINIKHFKSLMCVTIMSIVLIKWCCINLSTNKYFTPILKLFPNTHNSLLVLHVANVRVPEPADQHAIWHRRNCECAQAESVQQCPNHPKVHFCAFEQFLGISMIPHFNASVQSQNHGGQRFRAVQSFERIKKIQKDKIKAWLSLKNQTKGWHPDDIIEEGPITEHIATDGIDSDDQTAWVDVDHAQNPHEQHQFVAGLADVLITSEHNKTGQVQYLNKRNAFILSWIFLMR